MDRNHNQDQNENQEKQPIIRWTEGNTERSALWRSESRPSPPKRVIITNDSITGDIAYRNACEGTGMLWRGDFHNARQILNAMAHRVDHKPEKRGKPSKSPIETFHRYRMAVSNRARILGMLLIELEADHTIGLRRAPDARFAIAEAHGIDNRNSVMPLREVLGIIGAHEWRKKGIDIPFIGGRIHPHYGVFPPVRTEYISLVAEMPLPSHHLAIDIGTGTGVLAAILAKKGVSRIIATDNDPRAIACARENMTQLGISDRVEVISADMFPSKKAPLVVCNPPWLPARPATSMEKGIYDPENRMLYRFINELPEHLESNGEGWLILSNLAEHLGLRTRVELMNAIEKAGLKILDKIDTQPVHPKTRDKNDPLHFARAAETTSLWRLALLDM